MIPLFDLHCDTFSKLYVQKCSFSSPSLHISLEKAECFSPYIQICAIWSNSNLSDEEAYLSYKENIAYLDEINIKLSKSTVPCALPSFILAVEDARLLNNKISRLDKLYNDGVRVLTLCWKGNSCIGGGWDTDFPLTQFGKDVINKCFEKGIIIDLSHSSQEVQAQVMNYAYNLGFSPIYSHSNAFSICNHKRNLTDSFFNEILSLKGLVGISLCPEHLSDSGNADINTVVKHIYHYLCLGGESCISLGCDFDGISSLPNGISSIDDLSKLYAILAREFAPEIANKIFFYNAYNFFSNLL